MIKKIHFAGLTVVLVLSLMLAACGSNGNGNNGNGNNGNGGSANGGGSAATENNNKGGSKTDIGQKDITILGDNYQSATASMLVAKQLLEKIGYNVKLKQVGVGTMFAGMAKGSADVSLAVWLPSTHASYWKKYGDKLEKLGMIMKSVPLGLTVPDYMKDIQSIKDLADNKNNIGEKLNWTLTGISPGAGEMKLTENKVMPAYGLDKKWKLQQSSGPAMITALKSAIKNKKPIVVTLWYPHWAFVKWDLRLLKDPKNKYGDPDDIYAVGRKGLKEDSPAAAKLLSQFRWTKKDDESVMLDLQKGMDGDKAAQKFLKNHPDLEKKWLKGFDTGK